jgi:hypothetical protein
MALYHPHLRSILCMSFHTNRSMGQSTNNTDTRGTKSSTQMRRAMDIVFDSVQIIPGSPNRYLPKIWNKWYGTYLYAGWSEQGHLLSLWRSDPSSTLSTRRDQTAAASLSACIRERKATVTNRYYSTHEWTTLLFYYCLYPSLSGRRKLRNWPENKKERERVHFNY